MSRSIRKKSDLTPSQPANAARVVQKSGQKSDLKGAAQLVKNVMAARRGGAKNEDVRQMMLAHDKKVGGAVTKYTKVAPLAMKQYLKVVRPIKYKNFKMYQWTAAVDNYYASGSGKYTLTASNTLINSFKWKNTTTAGRLYQTIRELISKTVSRQMRSETVFRNVSSEAWAGGWYAGFRKRQLAIVILRMLLILCVLLGPTMYNMVNVTNFNQSHWGDLGRPVIWLQSALDNHHCPSPLPFFDDVVDYCVRSFLTISRLKTNEQITDVANFYPKYYHLRSWALDHVASDDLEMVSESVLSTLTSNQSELPRELHSQITDTKSAIEQQQFFFAKLYMLVPLATYLSIKSKFYKEVKVHAINLKMNQIQRIAFDESSKKLQIEFFRAIRPNKSAQKLFVKYKEVKYNLLGRAVTSMKTAELRRTSLQKSKHTFPVNREAFFMQGVDKYEFWIS